jgi:pyruvate,water dikinase
VETARLLRPVAQALASAGRDATPTSVAAVRELGDDVRAAVDEWERLHAWRLVTSDDVDHPTLAELPALRLAALLAAVARDGDGDADGGGDGRDGVRSDVRARVPAGDRARFDELVEEARYGNRQRDDIRGICWNWTAGLVRRAALEAGRRLVQQGRARSPEHAAELSPEELTAVLTTGAGPSASDLAARAAERDRIQAQPPPRLLGEVEAPPPVDALPRPMARATAALFASLAADTTDPGAEPLSGVGIGTQTYRGRACVLRDGDDGLDRLGPGDVLIAPFTGPSANSIVPLLGALVVEEGGVLCHAAIVAREFGLPAVVGAQRATTLIADGALVEVDPVRGVVRAV